ncbi:unnamed protein product, partial [Pylaiella littoralis]
MFLSVSFELQFSSVPSIFAKLGTRLRSGGLGATIPASVDVKVDEGAYKVVPPSLSARQAT